MELTVKRSKPIGEGLPGELLLDGLHFGFSLERVAVAIPTGRYRIGVHDSPHFKRSMPELLDVPGRSAILIHWGNYPENSDGCILVGESQDHATGDIGNTRAMFEELWRKILPGLENGVWITVS